MITGGGGFIGSIMVEYFLKKQYKVLCIDRFYFGFSPIKKFIKNKNFKFIQKDTRSLEPLDF